MKLDRLKGRELVAQEFGRLDVIERREDVSRFMVHLTRDDRADFIEDGGTARENLISILQDKEIKAYNAYCYHHYKLNSLPKRIQEEFKVACFSEAPLNEIKNLITPVEGQRCRLAPYGLVFTKPWLLKKGAQPALYINCYGDNRIVRKAFDQVFYGSKELKFADDKWRMLPFVNVMQENHDFAWEREWRIVGGLKFSYGNVPCLVLPENGEDDIKESAAANGIAWISTEWTFEKIFMMLAVQRRTLWKEALGKYPGFGNLE